MKFSLKQKITALIILTSVAFAPSLFNDFSGDDRYFLAQNTFYDHPKNIINLFSKSYNVDSQDYFLEDLDNKGSGSVAYRPILSLTYFFDTFIWGDNPFGFHLTNLLLHIANVLLVFFLFNRLIPKHAFFIASIFAIHPIQTEAVCSIGYRADVLATFWCLFAFWNWIRFRDCRHKVNLILASLGFLLGIFTKESAAPAFLVFILFDMLIQENKRGTKKLSDFLLPACILIFYCYIYFFVFRNTALTSIFTTDNLAIQLHSTLLIWTHQLYSFLWPYDITLIPPLFVPRISHSLVTNSLPYFFILCFLSSFLYYLKHNKVLTFCFAWFFVFYLPVSNIFPHPNPMGYRLMYLPSIGLFAIMAVFMHWGITTLTESECLQQIRHFLKPFFLATLVICTFTTTFLWKNNLIISRVWISEFPNHFKGYEVLAKEYYWLGFYEEAIPNYEKAIMLKTKNPTVFYEIGQCLLKTNDISQAHFYFKQAITIFPSYLNGYVGLVKIHIINKEFSELSQLKKKAQLNLNQQDNKHLHELISSLSAEYNT